MWDLVSHSGLWESFIENGNCTSTPFLRLQAFDFLKDSHRSALGPPHVPVPFLSLLAVSLCPRAWLKSPALVNVQIYPKCCMHTGCSLPQPQRLPLAPKG